MIENRIIVGIGSLVTLVKMTWKWRMYLISNPLVADAIIFIALVLVHMDTYSGAMVASVGAMTCSLTLSAARYLYGHVEMGTYVPGKFKVAVQL